SSWSSYARASFSAARRPGVGEEPRVDWPAMPPGEIAQVGPVSPPGAGTRPRPYGHGRRLCRTSRTSYRWNRVDWHLHIRPGKVELTREVVRRRVPDRERGQAPPPLDEARHGGVVVRGGGR